MSDPTATLASPLPTVRRRTGKRPPLRRLEEIAREHGVERLVFGLPLSPDGTDTDWSREVRGAATELSSRLDVPVDFVDERFTSALAERLVRSAGLRKSERERKDRVDAGAAALILQAWLDRSGAA